MKKLKNTSWYWIVKHIVLAVVIAFLLIFAAMQFLDWGTDHGEYLEVPEFVGMSFEEAQSVAAQSGVRLEIVDSVYSKRGRGLVREQNPSPGSKVKENRRILITMNAHGVQKVAVPNLVGYSTRQAIADLRSRGLRLGRIKYVNDIATNNVLKQQYRGRDIAPGRMIEAESSIDLVVGLNMDDSETLIPDVTGKRASDASRDLHDYYINVRSLRYDKSVRTYEDSLKAVVYRQAPEASQLPVKMGTDVTLYLRVEETEE